MQFTKARNCSRSWIGLYPQYQTFHRFLWRDSDSHKKPIEYEFNRLVLGVNSLPFLAQLVSHHLATIYEKAFPKAAKTVLQSTYTMESVLTDELGVDLQECILISGYRILQ